MEYCAFVWDPPILDTDKLQSIICTMLLRAHFIKRDNSSQEQNVTTMVCQLTADLIITGVNFEI